VGKDIEDVHHMRVATRRCGVCFACSVLTTKRSSTRTFTTELRHLAWTLGAVRDLDVLIDDVRTYQATLKAPQQADLQQAIDELDKQRENVPP